MSEYSYPKCSCKWSMQAYCRYSASNGIPNSEVKSEMSDCSLPGKDPRYDCYPLETDLWKCSYQVTKQVKGGQPENK